MCRFRHVSFPPLAALLVGGLLLISRPATRGHGDDLMLIEALTEELARQPDADLLIRRGELFRHHQEWAKAEADFLAAARFDPSLTSIDFFRARTLLEAGAPDKARPLIEHFVARMPEEAEGWFLRGDILAALGQHESGAADYAQGIQHAPHARPEHFLRRARLLHAAPGVDPVRVLAALDDGIAQLGPVIALVEYAITIEVERKNYDGALARIMTAMKHSPRREQWLVRRGDILAGCNRIDEAIVSYREALAAIQALPERYRKTVPVEKLDRDARSALLRLAKPAH